MQFSKLAKKYITICKKYPWKKSCQALKFLPQVCSYSEKIVILLLSGIIIISIIIMGINSWLSQTALVPDFGGTLREGIVGESKNLDQHLARLINSGLTKYDHQHNIIPDMAESWEINDNGKSYVFRLKPNFSSEELADRIFNNNIWQDIEISTPDLETITFNFKQPFSPFLYASTEPIFKYGPYRISKETKNEIELTAREDYFGGEPYINKIIIKIYSSNEELLKAAKRGDIDSFASTEDLEEVKNFKKLEMDLPRDLVIFFNLGLIEFQDINVRKALKENSSLGKELSFRIVTSENQKNVNMANQIAERWKQNGIQATVDIKDNITLQKDIIPKRDYDVLLYGLDYGEDPDPYPFWHSSQIKENGKNLSNFKNSKGDKLLEEARQEFDFKKREDKYAEFQKILDEEIPMFVVQQEDLYYYVSQKLYGVETLVGSNEADRFLDVSLWYINTKRIKK